MKRKIEATIVADSISAQGERITTMLMTFPRFILAELNTHRMFTRNSASSRAIPFRKMVEMVVTDPFIPIAWQKDHPGMQGTEYLTGYDTVMAATHWIYASEEAVERARVLNAAGVTKQICNRLLEPFMWHTALVTSTEFENFFNLRTPEYSFGGPTYKSKKDAIAHKIELEGENTKTDYDDMFWFKNNKAQAEIHMMALAEAVWDAMNESKPNELEAGQWHIPFGDKMDSRDFIPFVNKDVDVDDPHFELKVQPFKIKIATARCARLAYKTHDGEIDYGKDLELHDRLLKSGHFSVFEHCAQAMTEKEYYEFVKGKADLDSEVDDPHRKYWIDSKNLGWCNNMRGWIQYRYMLQNK